jgi:L-cysteine:1D-myo-inositol 2-amino-2-deoxy-alpha-D-glucopyranoside ligase
MHQGMVRLDGEKMSKSLGNLVFAEHLCKEWDPRAIRLACLSNHYRPGWDWHDQLMPDSAARLAAWVNAGEGDAALDDVRACLDDDLDTPGAIAAIDEAARAGHGVSQAAKLLGVTLS